MHFDDMNEMQRRLHNAAIVAESDGDEWGHANVMRDAITEIESVWSIAHEAYIAWDNDMDAKVGKLLRAILDEQFRKTYRPDKVPND